MSGLTNDGKDVADGRVDLARVPETASAWFSVLAVHPTLTKAFGQFGGRILNGYLEPLQREVLILRIAWLCRCEYEWRHHVPLALDLGLMPRDIAKIADSTVGTLRADLAQLVVAADEVFHTDRISQDTFNRLETTFSPEALLEVPFVVGFYRMVAGVMMSYRIESEEAYRGLPLPESWF